MKMLILENLKTGRADCEPYFPFPGQEILVEGKDFQTHIVESEELALSYLGRISRLAIDDEAIKEKVIEALELSNWVQKDAAIKLLKITPRAMLYHCKKFEIIHPEGKWGKYNLKLVRKVS